MTVRNRVIRDAVHGVSEIDPRLRAVLDTRELQRLRWIRQTGVAYLVYPGAEHSRFAHALGAFTLAGRVFAHLKQTAQAFISDPSPAQLDDDLMRAFQTAALCHDLGHTPFSHVFDRMLVLLPEGAQTHEEAALQLLAAEATEIAREIPGWCDLEEVKLLLQKKHPTLGLCDLISGDFDVDRWDYLLRDGRATGVRYGQYDLGWMIHSLLLRTNAEGQPIVVLDGKRGAVVLRQFLAARRYMYTQVYYHATVRGAGRLLRAIFERAMDPNRPWYADPVERSLVPGPLQRPLIEGLRPTLEDFLALDDALLLVTVRNWAAASRDPVLQHLSASFLRRRLPKEIVLPPSVRNCQEPLPPDLLNSVRAAVRPNVEVFWPGDPMEVIDYFVLQDTCPFEAGRLDNVYLDFEGTVRRPAELEEMGPDYRLGDLMESFSIFRLFVPEAAREAAQRALDGR